MENRIIVVPDVHGSDFWKKPVEENEESTIIFLGDYLDSYTGMSPEDEMDNFREIIDFKKKNAKRTVLLIGNHDRHYMPGCDEHFSRYNEETQRLVEEVEPFQIGLFDIVHQELIAGKEYIFTHAGIKRKWLKSVGLDGSHILVDEIRKLYKKDAYINFDSFISFYRGGIDLVGSPFWADVREYGKEDEFDGVVQIFGHTSLKEPINFNDRLYCLDARQCFIIDNEGVVKTIDGKKVMPFKEKLN